MIGNEHLERRIDARGLEVAAVYIRPIAGKNTETHKIWYSIETPEYVHEDKEGSVEEVKAYMDDLLKKWSYKIYYK